MRAIRVFCMFLALSSLVCSPWHESSYGKEASPPGQEALIDKYHEIERELKESTSPIPFYLESTENNNVSHGDIYGILHYPFDTIRNGLLVPANWCEIVLLHPDIRACTYQKLRHRWLINIYNVKKFSQPLGDAYHMKFVFPASTLKDFYFDIAFTADVGPFSTQDHHFEFEAVPVTTGSTFIHLSYSYGYSSWGAFLMKVFGSGKVGFTVTGLDSYGNPVYISGLRGSVERNVTRFYLAVLAYLDTLEIPVEQRFEKRIGEWYDSAALYKKQLLGMEKEEYLIYKRQDQRNQQRLQGDLNDEVRPAEGLLFDGKE
ncbi:MAG TPA: hypothetical protein VEI96_04340 [Thermodesulfovibrionales bacterium]|nr:hypothetical protein [Thermodesulfovibrionales bacterium]